MQTIHVLAIEDEPTDMQLLRLMLEAAQHAVYNVTDHTTLKAGLEATRHSHFDIAILDLSLPDSTGLETLSNFRKEQPDIPIVVISGHADEATGITALQEGAQDYLVKGQVETQILERTIRYSIERMQHNIAIESRNTMLETLSQLSSSITQTMDIDTISYLVCCQTAEALKTASTYLICWDQTLESYKICGQHSTGQTQPQLTYSDFALLNQSLPHPIETTTQLQTLHKDELDPNSPQYHFLDENNGSTILFVPLTFDENPLGSLVIWESNPHRHFTDSERQLATSIGDQTATSIHNAQLYSALQQSEARNAAILAANPDPIFRITEDGIYLDLQCNNPKYLDTLLLPASQVIGKHISQVNTPHVARIIHEAAQEALKTDNIQLHEYTIHSEGSLCTYELRMVPHNDHQVVAIIREVTEKKQAEENLRQTLATLNTHIQHTPLAVIETDAEFAITRWTSKAEEIFGWTLEEAAQIIPTFEHIHEDDRENVKEGVQKLVNGEINNYSILNRNYRKDGSIIHCEWYNSASFDKNANLLSLLSLVLDVTEREETRNTLHHVNQELTVLYRSMSYLLHAGDLEEVANKIAQAVISEMSQSDCGVILVDQESGSLQRIARTGSYAVTTNETLHLHGEGLVPKAVREKTTIYAPDVHQHPHYVPNQPETRSELVVPLIVTNDVIGVLDLQSRQRDAYQTQDIRIMEAFAKQAATVLQNAKLQTETEQITRHLILLNRVISIANATLDIEQMLQSTIIELATYFEATEAVAILISEDSQTFSVAFEYPGTYSPSFVGTTFGALNNALLTQFQPARKDSLILSKGESSIQSDLDRLSHLDTWQTATLIPLATYGDTKGIIILYLPQNAEQPQVNQLNGISTALSQSLENITLHQRIAKNNQILSEVVERRTTQLQRANERMSTILNYSNSPLLLLKGSGTIRDSNPAFTQIFGYEIDTLYNHHIRTLFPRRDRERLDTLLDNIATTNEVQRAELRVTTQNSDVLDVELVLAPIMDVDNPIEGIVCNLHDITRLKEVERLKDRFISNVSHELRTPLTSIILGANTLQNHFHKMTTEQAERAITRIREQSSVLNQLIEDLLAIARLESQGDEDLHEEFDIQHTLIEVLEELSGDADAKQQTLEADYQDVSFPMFGKHNDVARIWRNLISNAIKYTPEGGQIFSRLCYFSKQKNRQIEPGIEPLHLAFVNKIPPGKYYLGQVEDSGYGISESDINKVFDRFFRGKAAFSRIPGTGLGLSLVEEILKAYKGGIHAHSVEDEGSVFTFWLPREEESTK